MAVLKEDQHGSGHKRDQTVHARLEAWAIWLRGGTGQSSSIVQDDSISGQYRPFVPVEAIECSVTDDAIGRLPPDLLAAVRAQYCERSTAVEAARSLGIGRMALHTRLCHADKRIADWLRLRAAKYEATAVAYRQSAAKNNCLDDTQPCNIRYIPAELAGTDS